MGTTTSAASTAAASTGAASTGAASTAAASTTAAGATGSSLASLSGNEQTFLNLLLTQLKNQDPTTPVDTNQFTTELVQYSQVEQQINTNSSLTQLVGLTQSGDLLAAGALVGKQLDLASATVPLQNGKGIVEFTSAGAQTATISITNAAGAAVKTATVDATAGSNTFTWDGTNDAGQQQADGPYTVSVLGASTAGVTAALPFTVLGTATGITRSGTAIDLQLGATSLDLGSVLSVVN
jgi:flagellar basal-body rod modification protein FlgD